MHGNVSAGRPRPGWRARTALTLALLAAAAVPARAAEEPRLRRVTLSTGGVGLFDFAAEQGADGAVRLSVPLEQVDDVLRSLVVQGARGAVRGVTLPGATPAADLFRDAPVTEGDLASLPALLEAMRGTEVGVAGPTRLRGRVLNVAREEVREPGDQGGGAVLARHRVGLLTADGLRSFILEEAEGLELADADLRARLQRLLEGLAAARGEQRRELVLSLGGPPGPVGLAYLAEAPVWKAAYRLVVDDRRGTAELQGWAVLENASGHDWRDVEVTLAAGSPRALRQALHAAYRVERPEVPVASAADATGEGPPSRPKAAPLAARSAPSGAAAPEAAFAAAEADAAGSPPPDEAALAPLAAAAGEELAAQTLYRLPERVSVAAGQSLTAPLVARGIPVERLAVLTSEQRGPHPRAALRLTNPGDAPSLPPGLVAVLDRSADPGGALSFAGDAALPATPPGAERVLPFAADGRLEARTAQARPRRVAGARVVDGLLELTVVEQAVTTVELRSEDDAPRRLLVDWERPADWRVAEPADAAAPPGRARFERDIPARSSQDLRLVLERERLRRFALIDERGRDVADEVVAATGGADLPGPLAAALGRLRELAAVLAEAEAEVGRQEAERARLAADQERLRTNLATVPAEGDLTRRLLQSLATSETRIEAIDGSLAAARAAVEQAAAARREFVRGLRI